MGIHFQKAYLLCLHTVMQIGLETLLTESQLQE